MNQESRDLLQSRTTWGAIISLLAMLSMQLGWDVGDQGAWVEGIVAAVGLGLVLWGRISATKEITSVAGVSIQPKPPDKPEQYSDYP